MPWIRRWQRPRTSGGFVEFSIPPTPEFVVIDCESFQYPLRIWFPSGIPDLDLLVYPTPFDNRRLYELR